MRGGAGVSPRLSSLWRYLNNGKWRCAVWCSVVCVRWGSGGPVMACTVQSWYIWYTVLRHCQPVSLKMAPGQLSPLSPSVNKMETLLSYIWAVTQLSCALCCLPGDYHHPQWTVICSDTLYTEWLTAIMLHSVCVVTFRKRLKKVACFRVKCSVSMGSENPV